MATAAAGQRVLQLRTKHFACHDLSQDVRAWRIVTDAALEDGRPSILREVVGQPAAGAAALLKSYAAERRLDDARRIARACFTMDAGLYQALLDACADCRDSKAAEEIMAEAVAADFADIPMYNAAVRAHAQADKLQRARAAVRSMQERGLQPNVVTFNELLNAAVKHGAAGVWELMAEMQACGARPNGYTCAILLKAVRQNSRASDVERVLEVVQGLEEPMDEVLLCSTLEACVRAGRSDLLVRQLRGQRGSGVALKGAAAYGHVIRAYGHLGDLDAAWAAWREMQRRHIMPISVTLGCMVEALVSNGDVDAGYKIIHEALDDAQTRPLVNAVIYCSVLKGYSHKKQFHKVWAVHDEMRAQELKFSVVTYNALIDACARGQEMARIQPLLGQLSADGIAPNVITYSTVLKAYCQANRLDSALEVFEEMKKDKSLQPDEVTYNTILDGCARLCLFDRGMGAFRDMEDAGVRPSAFTLSVLVKLASRSKKLHKAFELCAEVSAKYHIRLNVHVYNNLINACTANSDLPRAFEVFRRMLDEKIRPEVRTYNMLLRGCLGAKKAAEASAVLLAAAGLGRSCAMPATEVGDFGDLGPAAALAKGALTSELVMEVLDGIAGACGQTELAMRTFQELRRAPGLRLDSKVARRLASRALPAPAAASAAGRPAAK